VKDVAKCYPSTLQAKGLFPKPVGHFTQDTNLGAEPWEVQEKLRFRATLRPFPGSEPSLASGPIFRDRTLRIEELSDIVGRIHALEGPQCGQARAQGHDQGDSRSCGYDARMPTNGGTQSIGSLSQKPGDGYSQEQTETSHPE